MTGDSDVPPPGVNDTFWSARWEGTLYVPEDGNYTFYLKNLDDGGRLYIDDMNTPVLESWLVQGFHTYQVTVPLTAGPHVIRVEFAQGPPVDYGLIVEWELEASFREKIGPYSRGIVTPTATPTPTPTFTPTATPTFTPTPTPRPTHPPTPTPVPTSPPPWWAPAEQVLMQDEPPRKREGFSTLLSRIRDQILLSDPKGEAYVRMIYRHAPEITRLLAKDEHLRLQVKALALEVQPLLEAMLANRPPEESSRLSAAQVEEALRVLEAVERQASPDLKQEIQWWKERLPEFVGKTGLEIWKMLPARSK